MSKNKKRFKSKFYAVDFYRMVRISELPDDNLIPVKLYGNLNEDIVKQLEKDYGFTPERCESLAPNQVVYSMKGLIANKNLNDCVSFTKSFTKENTISILYNKQQYNKIYDKDGYLFAGWNKRYKTKIKPEDLPESYVYLSYYAKHGYIETAGISDIVYVPGMFDDHAFKDDFLFISYAAKLEYNPYKPFDLYGIADEYVFGNDIINVLKGIEVNNSENIELLTKIKETKKNMVNKYNKFADIREISHVTEKDLF